MSYEYFNFDGKSFETFFDKGHIFVNLDKLDAVSYHKVTLRSVYRIPFEKRDGITFIDIQHLDLYWEVMFLPIGFNPLYLTYFIDDLVKFWTLERKLQPIVHYYSGCPFVTIEGDNPKLCTIPIFLNNIPSGEDYLKCMIDIDCTLHLVGIIKDSFLERYKVLRLSPLEDTQKIMQRFVDPEGIPDIFPEEDL